MKIKVNERLVEIEEGSRLYAVRGRIKPGADVVILNGAMMNRDCQLSDGDRVALIRRGERPGPEEMETLLVARHTPGVHEKVKRAVVGIAGLGGLGSAIAVALARIGVGRLVLVDFDVVEPSNLNRQQYFVDQIGMPKTEAIKVNLARINPYVAVVTHNVKLDEKNVTECFSDVDVLVEAFDNAEGKVMLMECFTAGFPGKPLVMASGLAGYEASNSIQTRKVGKNVYVVGDLVNAARPGQGLMAPRVGVAAHHQANAVLRLLMGEDPVGKGSA